MRVAAERNLAGAHVVEQAAGRRDEHVEAARQHRDLRAGADAAEDAADPHGSMPRIDAEAFRDLPRKLARRRKDERAHMAAANGLALAQQAIEDGQREGRRLAGAGLGDAEKIVALEKVGDRAGLDGRRNGITRIAHGARKRLGKAEIREVVQEESFNMRRSRDKREYPPRQGIPRNGPVCRRGDALDSCPENRPTRLERSCRNATRST